jgi:nitrogen regulatory protein PII
MKLIKAYIRTNMIDNVIQALEAGGFTDMTLIDVKAIRDGNGEKDKACRDMSNRMNRYRSAWSAE